jgi:hypothetical protein
MRMRRIDVAESDESNQYNITIILSNAWDEYETKVSILKVNKADFEEEQEEGEEGPIRKLKWTFQNNEEERTTLMEILITENQESQLINFGSEFLRSTIVYTPDSETEEAFNRLYTDIRERFDGYDGYVVETPPIQPGNLNGGTTANYQKSYFCKYKK